MSTTRKGLKQYDVLNFADYLNAFREHPEMSLKEQMKAASKTYKKTTAAKKPAKKEERNQQRREERNQQRRRKESKKSIKLKYKI